MVKFMRRTKFSLKTLRWLMAVALSHSGSLVCANAHCLLRFRLLGLFKAVAALFSADVGELP